MNQKLIFLLFFFIGSIYAQQPDQIKDFKIVGPDTLRMHVFNPKDLSTPLPAIVFFFGGGWNGGNPKQFYPHCQHLAELGMVAMAAEYRVYRRQSVLPFECVKDAKSAVRWIRTHANELSIDPNRLAAGGGSAGGHLAAATAVIDAYNDPQDDLSVSARPDALVLFNPVYDNGPDGYGYKRVNMYWPYFSPMHNLEPGTPPTIVFLGTEDPLIPVETAQKYQSIMQKNGDRSELYIYEGQKHGFFNYRDGNNEYYDKTVAEMDAFLRSLGYIE